MEFYCNQIIFLFACQMDSLKKKKTTFASKIVKVLSHDCHFDASLNSLICIYLSHQQDCHRSCNSEDYTQRNYTGHYSGNIRHAVIFLCSLGRNESKKSVECYLERINATFWRQWSLVFGIQFYMFSRHVLRNPQNV